MRNTSLYRIKHLVRNDIDTNSTNLFHYLLGSSVVIFGLYVFLDLGYSMWAAVLIGISVNYFVIFENKVRIMDFLLLPANLKEKFAAKIISLGICYPIVTFVGATIAIFFGSKITGNPLSATEAIAAIFVFYPFQALLLWGSIHFKKNGLLKSVIVFAIIALFTGIIYIFTNAGLATVYPYYNAVYEYKKISDGYLPNLVKYYGIFSAVFATISLWTVSYFGLKEKEV